MTTEPMNNDCPRRSSPRNPSVFKFDAEPDHWRTDRTCSYCGSMHPDDVIELVRSGNAEIVPTDKNYKAYVRNRSGAETEEGKFYYPHFSGDQMQAFIDLCNSRAMHIGYPGYFYVLPYFMRIVPKEDNTNATVQ